MQKNLKNILESIVVIAIFLVLIQTFLEDYAVITGWSWNVRRILIFTGLGFDLFFSLEFLLRFFSAAMNRKGSSYFMEGRGWIDFLASVPLLLLNSGPAFFALLTGGSFFFGVGGILNILKIIKAIRIARILRLLRILKIFKQIKHTGSRMAQRHVAKITTLSITSFVFTLLLFSVFADIVRLPSPSGELVLKQQAEILEFTKGAAGEDSINVVESFAGYDQDLLIIKQTGKTLYSRYDNPYYSSVFGPGDYQYYKTTEYEFFFDTRSLSKIQSSNNILFFIIVVISVLVFLIYYSPHFALTITDPIHVMKRGYLEKEYNLEVDIPPLYHDDDIYVLGNLYNENYLPMKARQEDSTGPQTDLSMDDFEDLFK